MSGSGDRIDILSEYRTAPLSFPLHILDYYGEPLCGNLTEQQVRYLRRHGYLDQPTLAEKRGDEPWETFLGSLCGNCRTAFLAKIENEDVQQAWEARKEAVDSV